MKDPPKLLRQVRDAIHVRHYSLRNETAIGCPQPSAHHRPSLVRKGRGKEAKLCHQANALMEHRHGLIVGADVRRATGTSERDAALDLIDRRGDIKEGTTLAGDKGYNTVALVAELKDRGVTAHFASNTGGGRRSAISESTAATEGYQLSQKKRKRIEQSFGWIKTVGMLGQLQVAGIKAVRAVTTFNFAMYNLIRMGGISEWWNPSPT